MVDHFIFLSCVHSPTPTFPRLVSFKYRTEISISFSILNFSFQVCKLQICVFIFVSICCYKQASVPAISGSLCISPDGTSFLVILRFRLLHNLLVVQQTFQIFIFQTCTDTQILQMRRKRPKNLIQMKRHECFQNHVWVWKIILVKSLLIERLTSYLDFLRD